jgi:hypothetical protein
MARLYWSGELAIAPICNRPQGDGRLNMASDANRARTYCSGLG